jgi:putative membrane protein
MTGRVVAFAGGIGAIWIAMFSPLAHLDHRSLTAHMAQHLLLMLAAAPLILLGSRSFLARWRPSLPFCWLSGALTVLLWHVPAVFELALRSHSWHHFEHATFLIAGLVFWWPVFQPAPYSRWSLPVYLFLATLPCDALSAFLAFCGHVVYRPYLAISTGLFGLSPLDDQALAGALMWVTVTFAYLIPALVLTAKFLANERTRASCSSQAAPAR